jgi:hypothetical protein
MLHHAGRYYQGANGAQPDRPEKAALSDVFALQPENYGTVIYLLNQQYTRLVYLARLLEDHPGDKLRKLRQTAADVKEEFGRLLRLGSTSTANVEQVCW